MQPAEPDLKTLLIDFLSRYLYFTTGINKAYKFGKTPKKHKTPCGLHQKAEIR